MLRAATRHFGIYDEDKEKEALLIQEEAAKAGGFFWKMRGRVARKFPEQRP